MKVVISEKQLAKLIGKQKEIDEASTDPTSTTSSASSASSTNTNSPTDDTTGEPTGKGAMDFPAYPEVDKAEDLVKRGVANPVDYTKKHYEDYPEANPVRGRANPIKGM
jgi:hypothetical protein